MEKKLFNSPLFSTVENIPKYGVFLGSYPIKNPKNQTRLTRINMKSIKVQIKK